MAEIEKVNTEPEVPLEDRKLIGNTSDDKKEKKIEVRDETPGKCYELSEMPKDSQLSILNQHRMMFPSDLPTGYPDSFPIRYESKHDVPIQGSFGIVPKESLVHEQIFNRLPLLENQKADMLKELKLENLKNEREKKVKEDNEIQLKQKNDEKTKLKSSNKTKYGRVDPQLKLKDCVGWTDEERKVMEQRGFSDLTPMYTIEQHKAYIPGLGLRGWTDKKYNPEYENYLMELHESDPPPKLVGKSDTVSVSIPPVLEKPAQTSGVMDFINSKVKQKGSLNV
jgi:hypothetical protein